MRKFSIKKFFSYRNLKRLYYHRIIFPIYKSKRPISEIALGVSVGVFWGLTPTVGAQMYIVFLQWILHKTFIRFKFDLNLAIAMVWISNPFFSFPLYLHYHRKLQTCFVCSRKLCKFFIQMFNVIGMIMQI